MKSFALLFLAVLSSGTISSGSESLPASAVSWKGHFGESRADTNTLFCLMAHGYFRSETTNIQSVLDTWLKEHPKAVVVKVVAGGPVLTKQQDSKQSYVWIVEGTNNLNVELVRKGCLAPETQILSPEEKPLVPQSDYDTFVQRVADASKEAKAFASASPGRSALEASAQITVPMAREEKWRQDFRFLARELPRRHKNLFFHLPRAEFERAVADLDQSIPSLQDDEIVVRLMKIVAAIGDGHTSLGWRAEATGFHEFPIGLYWFRDSLYVVNAAPAYRQALGKRLIKIGETPIAEAYARVVQLIPHDNEIGLRLLSPTYLVTPEVLHALAILPDRDKGSFVFEDENGSPFPLDLEPVRLGEQRERLSATKGPTPLYRNPRDEFYWFEYLADSQTLYFHYRTCMEMKALSFSQFEKSLLAFADTHPVERFVIDLRLNPGGNEGILRPLIRKLKSRAFNQRGRLFVIIGPRTASSAMDNALTLKEKTRAILVGQPTSGKPNSYGEVKKMTLPNSGLTVQYSTKYWHKLKDDPPSLEPDIRTEVSFGDYEAGRDPAMEAILNYR